MRILMTRGSLTVQILVEDKSQFPDKIIFCKKTLTIKNVNEALYSTFTTGQRLAKVSD